MGRESSKDAPHAHASQPSDWQDGSDDVVADEALDWFARRRNATPVHAEQAAFRAWRQRSPRHAEAYDDLEALWELPAFVTAARGLPVAEPSQVNTSARRPVRRSAGIPLARRLSTRLGAVAALLMLAVGIWQAPALLLRWQADYRTAAGDRATITLPDGSTLILNTASAVALDFEGGRRDVRLLQGEAFFDVLQDPEHPFRVAGEFGAVEVKGTAFSVRAGEAQDTILLERGRVEVRRVSQPNEQVTLEPGEQVVATVDALSAVEPADPAATLAWRQGRILFDDQPVATVLAELRRYRSAPIFVATRKADGFRVSGNYRTTDIEGALRSLADAAGVTLTALPGGVLILR
ncbi:FecR family protein [Kaistia terrae]|uniref:FecR family protein n=1 Tax=Kaistia terrae TaxID=537017 RepID=A0ABW0Q0Q9_9HYPH|nr:FecR domain-containing protein [Kaistia terrae]MCX5581764.1 FecR domain-containing protein [Kaistia terrae]